MGEKVFKRPAMDGETLPLSWGIHPMDARGHLPENL
jgi:hypothetical protein